MKSLLTLFKRRQHDDTLRQLSEQSTSFEIESNSEDSLIDAVLQEKDALVNSTPNSNTELQNLAPPSTHGFQLLDTMSPKQRVTYEALRQTLMPVPDDFNKASPCVLDYLTSCERLTATITSNSERLRTCVAKAIGGSPDSVPEILVWLEIAGKLSLLGDWTKPDFQRLGIEWIRLFQMEKETLRDFRSLQNGVERFQSVLQQHIQELLRGDKELLAQFKTYIPADWIDIASQLEEVEEASKPVDEVPSPGIYLTCTFSDLIISEECSIDNLQQTKNAAKFSRLKQDVQCKLVCQLLEALTYLLTQISTELKIGTSLYFRQVALKLPKSGIIQPLDCLLVTFGLKGLLEAHVQDAILYSNLFEVLKNFHFLLAAAKEALGWFSDFGNLKKRNINSQAISEVKAELRQTFLHFEMKFPLKENLLRSVCCDFLLNYGEVQEIPGMRPSANQNAEKASTLRAPSSSRNRDEIETTVVTFCRRFIHVVTDATGQMLRLIQVPRATVGPSQTSLGGPPIGFLEGLSHIIATASLQLKLCPERSGRDAERLRKDFLNLTSALTNLDQLAQEISSDFCQKLEPTLSDLEAESDAELEQLHGNHIPKLECQLPIVQCPNPECVQATWNLDEAQSDTENYVSETLSADWDPNRQVITCTVPGMQFQFSKLGTRDQLSIFKVFLAQALQTVEIASAVSQRSNTNLKDAKETVTAFWSYLRQMQISDEIRPEEKHVLLMVLRAHLQTVYYLTSQLSSTLKRCRVSLSYAIWHIRTKLGLLENGNQNGGTPSKGNPFGYGSISVQIFQPIELCHVQDKPEVPSTDEREFTRNLSFFRHLSAAATETISDGLLSVLTCRSLLCGAEFGRSDQKLSKVINVLLLLGQGLATIANFRDSPENQRSLLLNGLSQLQAKLRTLNSKSSLQQKLNPALEQTGAEMTAFSSELSLFMDVGWNEADGNFEQFLKNAAGETISETISDESWTLKLDTRVSELDSKNLLVLGFDDVDVSFSDLSCAKQGRVVIEIVHQLLTLIQETYALIHRAAFHDLENCAKGLRSLRGELKAFLSKDDFGRDVSMTAELSSLIKLLRSSNEVADAAFRHVNAEILKANRLVHYLNSYVKMRFKIEPSTSSNTTIKNAGISKRHKHKHHGFEAHRLEQRKQLERWYKRKVGEIETFIHASLKNTCIQIPLNLKVEKRIAF